MTDMQVCANCEQAKPFDGFASCTARGKRYPWKTCRDCVNAANARKKAPLPPLPTREYLARLHRGERP